MDAGKAVDAKVVEEEDEEDDDDDYDETDEEASGKDDEDKMLDMDPDGSDFFCDEASWWDGNDEEYTDMATEGMAVKELSSLWWSPAHSTSRLARASSGPNAAATAASTASAVGVARSNQDHDDYSFGASAYEATVVSSVSEADFLGMGNKMVALLALLALSVNQGDKILVFSQSIYALDLIEMCLEMPDWGNMVKVSAIAY